MTKKTTTKRSSSASKSKSAPRKSSTAKKSATTRGKKGSQKKRQAQSNRTPLYILTIMAMGIGILYLINSQFLGPDRSAIRREVSHNRPHPSPLPKKPSNETTPEVIPPVKKVEEKKAITRNLRVYYLRVDDRTEKVVMKSVVRVVDSDDIVRRSIEELIKGPSSKEKRKGVLTAVPSSLKLRDIRTQGRSVILDFNSDLEKGAAGNILLKRVDQIVYTATQFNNIDTVQLRINGRRRTTLGADGLSISGHLHRR